MRRFRSAARFAWRRSGRGGMGGAVAVALVAAVLVLPTVASADGRLTRPTATPVGDFAGVQYVQYDGILAGQTSTGSYRVPYRITAPAQPRRGNRTVLVEAPHFAAGLGTLDLHLGRDFLFSRGFSHAGVGYGTTDFGDGANLRILDPSVPGVFINGGFADEGGRTDDEIIVDLAGALTRDAQARSILGRVQRRYLTGFSDASQPVLRIVTSGAANGVFDLAFPFTAEGMDPQSAVADGRYRGRLMILNSEFEGASADYVDRGVARRRYRFYAEAGTPHLPDVLVPFPSNQTTPASYEPALRAHFMQADRWVQQGKQPPPSAHLLAADGQTLDRDATATRSRSTHVAASCRGSRSLSSARRATSQTSSEAMTRSRPSRISGSGLQRGTSTRSRRSCTTTSTQAPSSSRTPTQCPDAQGCAPH